MPYLSRRLIFAALAGVLAVTIGTAIAIPSFQERAALLRGDPESILTIPDLRHVAVREGGQVYQARCATCHGTAGKGDPTLGAPDLTDAEHLYGAGTVHEIEEIVRHGIRSGDPRGWHLAGMPAYATARPYENEPLPPLTPAQIADVTQFVLGLGGRATDHDAAERGSSLYQNVAGCWDCHGRNAAGDPAIGAPSLTDDIWHYGGTAADIGRSIAYGRGGRCPAFKNVLSAIEVRSVAVYVASLRVPIPQPRGQ